MKKLVLSFLTLMSLSAFAATDVYTCQSKEGILVIKDFDSGVISIDLTDHSMILVNNVLLTLAYATSTSSDFYKDFVLRLTGENMSTAENTTLDNTYSKIVFQTSVSEGMENCKLGVGLYKSKGLAKVNFACNVLFKTTVKFDDSLKCKVTEE